MSQTVTIELPDDAVQKLGVPADALEAPIQKLVLDMLNILDELVRSLQHSKASIRIQSAKTLGNMKIEAAVPALRQALKDNDLMVQESAVEALKKIKTADALQAISQHPFVRLDKTTSKFIFDPLSALAGTLESNVNDLSENHDLYLAEDLERELHFSD